MNTSTTAVMSTIEESHEVRHARSMVSLMPPVADENASSLALRPMISGSAHVRTNSDTTAASDESLSALLNAEGDPRGEAPPYETINLSEEPQPGVATSSTTAVSPHPPQHNQTPSERHRLPGFLSFFIPRSANHANLQPALGPSGDTTRHSRGASGPSFPILTSVESHGSARASRSRRGHRSSNSVAQA